MHPQPSALPSSQLGIRYSALNGETSHRQHDNHLPGAADDENAVLSSEIHHLAAQIEQLSTANRHKDEFLAMLSHELRSPLASIQHGIGILRGHKGSDDTVRRGMHELIERQLRKIAKFASGLSDVGRITSGHLLVQPERTELSGVLAKAIQTVEQEFVRRSQELLPVWPSAGISLMADPGRLEQVFVNLLVNASKYSDPGGRISISTSIQGQHAIVRIKDSGIGITAQALPHIFDLYVQVDATAARSRSGLGIGLALVRKIVELHGGTVTAASAGLGHGSEFIVRLPAQTPEGDN